MHVLPSIRALSFAAGLLIAGAGAVSAQSAALSLPATSALNGRSYAIDFSQVMTIQANTPAEISRNVQLRATIAAAAAAGRTALTFRIDSARGTASNPHAREVLDLRRLVGTTYGAVSADSGRPVTWRPSDATLGFGDTGGALPLRAFLEMLVPALPGRPVRVGQSWERTWTQEVLIGQVRGQVPTRARFTVERAERAAGAAAWRIRFIASPVGSTAPAPTATGSMLVGADGVLHELTMEENRQGNDWEFSGQRLRYAQVDRWTITLRSGSPARP